jgi:hypothetical protein
MITARQHQGTAGERLGYLRGEEKKHRTSVEGGGTWEVLPMNVEEPYIAHLPEDA